MPETTKFGICVAHVLHTTSLANVKKKIQLFFLHILKGIYVPMGPCSTEMVEIETIISFQYTTNLVVLNKYVS